MAESEGVGRSGAPATRDYFAEMYVAGLLADAGWDIYFPRRDNGFDMIVSRRGGHADAVVRPVQVKGKYASEGKTDKDVYGYVGSLTALHHDMILALPFFTTSDAAAPGLIAWAPRSQLRSVKRGFAFEPATFVAGQPRMRRDFTRFFGEQGLRSFEQREFT